MNARDGFSEYIFGMYTVQQCLSSLSLSEKVKMCSLSHTMASMFTFTAKEMQEIALERALHAIRTNQFGMFCDALSGISHERNDIWRVFEETVKCGRDAMLIRASKVLIVPIKQLETYPGELYHTVYTMYVDWFKPQLDFCKLRRETFDEIETRPIWNGFNWVYLV